MPRASNGTYTLPTAVNPVVVGTKVTANWANTTLSDIASVLTSCLDRAGRGGMQANLALGGYKITGLAAGTGTGEAVNKDQLDEVSTVASAALPASSVTAFMLTLLNDPDAPTARTTLGTDVYKTVPEGTASGELEVITAGKTINTGPAAGSVQLLFNNSASDVTLTQGAGVTMRLDGTALTGDRTLLAYGKVTLHWITTSLVVVSGSAV